MVRFTDKLRKSAGVRDDDPVAPVFDAVDLMAARVDASVEQMGHFATQAGLMRRHLVRGIAIVGFVLAVASSCLAFAGASFMVRSIESRIADQARALEEVRTRSFDARVEQRAAAVAFDVVTQANGRAAAAEAQLELARDRLAAALGRNADDEVRDIVRLSAAASREDVALLRKLLRHPDASVRRTCDALTTGTPATVAKLLEYLTANKGRF